MQKIKDFLFVAGLVMGVFLVFAGWTICSVATTVIGLFTYGITSYLGIVDDIKK